MALKLKLGKGLLKRSGDGEKPGRSAANPQGIVAQGNALRQIVSRAALVILIPLLLSFVYLISLREPMLQQDRIDHIASGYALQQATNVQHFISSLRQRLQSSAETSLARDTLAPDSNSGLPQLEATMLSFFPEAIGLRIIPLDDMGTANFTSGEDLRNHIELDLVRQASRGGSADPESYKVDDRWLTSLAHLVKHPDNDDLRAILLITFDNDTLTEKLRSANETAGRFKLEQPYKPGSDNNRFHTVAKFGVGDSDELWYADVKGSPWRVAFQPSAALVEELTINKTPLYLLLLVAVMAALTAVALILLQFPRKLAGEVEKIMAGADRKAELSLAVPELVVIARQLRRATLRALRQSEAPAASPAAAPQADPIENSQLANPLFQSTTILDDELEEEGLDLDLDAQAASAEAAAADSGLPEHIFRAYDIRGNARTELTDELVSSIGKAVGTMADELGEGTLIIGCDGRASSPRIKSTLVRALMETGRDIVDIGVVPTPLLYYATQHLEYRSGIMITGSHNPPDDNGLKIVLDRHTIAAGGIKEIRDRIVAGEFASGNGRLVREDVIPPYIDELVNDIAIAVPLKIVIDAGNGATSEIAPELFRELGCEVIPLYCELDGSFPNHPPDTSNEHNLLDLARTVKEQEADFGVAFDGDGDRLAVVTSSGRIIRTDVLMMLYAQDVVSRNPGADVVFDVKCSRNLTNIITHHGGRPVLWKTGHAFMKEKMRETGALLGGEFSGHIFFGERWYGFDDGMYAAARLAEIMSTQGDTLDEAVDKFPNTVSTPEIIIPVAEGYKFQLIDKIVNNADFSSGKVNTMDGIRVDFSDGWGLVRASNTGPALTARFEADNAENLALIQDEFRAQIALIDPKVELNF